MDLRATTALFCPGTSVLKLKIQIGIGIGIAIAIEIGVPLDLGREARRFSLSAAYSAPHGLVHPMGKKEASRGPIAFQTSGTRLRRSAEGRGKIHVRGAVEAADPSRIPGLIAFVASCTQSPAASGNPAIRRRWTWRSAISAGVTPSIRAACASVGGRRSFSLARASLRNPGMRS